MNSQIEGSIESVGEANKANEDTEAHLRGAVGGPEQRAAVDHTDYEKSRNPDSELRLDDEDDSLYSDGLDIGDDTEPLAGTDGDNLTGVKG